MIGLLLAMYPARWRSRYGEEFRAVLESRPLGPYDFADVLMSALDARLAPRRLPGSAGLDGGPSMMLRIGGVGAIAGGALWFAGLAGASVLGGDQQPWALVGAVGTFGLLLALVGLSAFQAYRDPVLAWVAFAIPGLGALASVVGLVVMAVGPGEDPMVFGSIGAWSVWSLGLSTTVVGSIFFALATLRAEVFSRMAASALGVSSAVVLLVAFGLLGGEVETAFAQVLIGLSLGSFAASWIALGTLALRRGPIRAIAPV
jgi:hypothetical protein